MGVSLSKDALSLDMAGGWRIYTETQRAIDFFTLQMACSGLISQPRLLHIRCCDITNESANSVGVGRTRQSEENGGTDQWVGMKLLDLDEDGADDKCCSVDCEAIYRQIIEML